MEALTCSYEDFFWLPIMHILIYGVVKMLVCLLLRNRNVRLHKGNALRFSPDQRRAMQKAHADLCSTSAFSKRLPEVVKCVS